MLAILALAGVAVPGPRTAHLGATTTLAPPRSRIAAAMRRNGSSLPAGGAVWPTAIYWAMLQVGTPPRSFPAAIDSGSGDLDIAALGCDGCVTAPPNNQYDHAASSTSKPAFPFVFHNTYETCDLKHPTKPCSIGGKLYTDVVSMGGLGPVPVKLGAIESQDTNFDQFAQIDGVVGFTSGGSEDVFSQLVAAKACDNIWSICMHRGSKSNGTLTLGGVDSRLSDGPMVYVPDVGRGFRAVQVASFTLVKNTSSAAVAAGTAALPVTLPVQRSAILDTGTNVLLLPPELLSRLGEAMCADASLAHCRTLWGDPLSSSSCVALSEAEVDAYPSLRMQLDGTALEMSGRDYLLRGSPLASHGGEYCLGIRSGGELFIIGDTTMRNYLLAFDLGGRRVGWAPVNRKRGGCGSVDEGEVPAKHAVETRAEMR